MGSDSGFFQCQIYMCLLLSQSDDNYEELYGLFVQFCDKHFVLEAVFQ